MSIAEDVVNGEICQFCCGSPPATPKGYPFTCRSCQTDGDLKERPPKKNKRKIKCPICDRRIKHDGFQNHVKDKHPSFTEKINKAIIEVLKEN